VLWDTISALNQAVRRWVTVGVLRNEQSHYVEYHKVMMDLDNLANLIDAWINGCFLVFMYMSPFGSSNRVLVFEPRFWYTSLGKNETPIVPSKTTSLCLNSRNLNSILFSTPGRL
jgi:hypothetical protein